MALIKSNDHWAFLERIEAPMWVDLTLEANSNNQDVDEEWFRTGHLIHQSSSDELKSAVHVFEEDMIIDSVLEGASPPKSVHSVSRSRGNEYKSKKWRENGYKSFSKKQRQVEVGSKKPSREKRKSKSSISKFKGTSETRAVREIRSNRNSRENYSKPIPSSDNSGNGLDCKVDEAGVSSSSNIVTSVNNFQEVPRSEINKDIKFLEFMKTSLRKSYATRKPSRVEVNNDKRESNGSRSFSGKSSVGSSCDPGHDIKSATISSTLVKETTPDSKDVVKMNQVVMSKAKVANTSKAYTFQVDRYRRVDKMKPVYQEAAKSKVMPNGQDSSAAAKKGFTKVKVGASGYKRAEAAGKENATGKVVNGRHNGARGMLWVQKGAQQTAQLKEKLKDRNVKMVMNTRPHFR